MGTSWLAIYKVETIWVYCL